MLSVRDRPIWCELRYLTLKWCQSVQGLRLSRNFRLEAVTYKNWWWTQARESRPPGWLAHNLNQVQQILTLYHSSILVAIFGVFIWLLWSLKYKSLSMADVIWQSVHVLSEIWVRSQLLRQLLLSENCVLVEASRCLGQCWGRRKADILEASNAISASGPLRERVLWTAGLLLKQA